MLYQLSYMGNPTIFLILMRQTTKNHPHHLSVFEKPEGLVNRLFFGPKTAGKIGQTVEGVNADFDFFCGQRIPRQGTKVTGGESPDEA